MANISQRNPTGVAATTSGLDVLLGIWLLISPWVLMFRSGVAVGNDVVLGIVIAIVAGIRFSNPIRATTGLSWLNFLLGLWVLISPWVLGYAALPSALWNNIAVGVAVMVLSASSALSNGGNVRSGYDQRV
jgi:hypothetical protein